MDLILWLVLIVAGIWAVLKGTLPSWLFGGGKYKIEGNKIRLLGIFLCLAPILSLVVLFTVLPKLIIFEDFFLTSMYIEWILLLGIAIVANIVIRIVRKPIPDQSKNLGKEQT